MADSAPVIFNKKATEKLRSPDDLDKFIRVTNPSVWVVLGACLALVLGLLAWGIFGSVASSVAATGVYQNGTVECFVSTDDVTKLHVGDVANVDGTRMKVKSIDEIPMSRGEVDKALQSDYLLSSLIPGDWGYRVEFEGDASELYEKRPLPVTITVESIAPISLVFGDKQ